VSPELERIIGKCLEKEPEDRYQSAKELAIDLRRLLTPSAVQSVETPFAGRKLWKALVAAALILVAAVIAGAFYVRSRQSPTRLTEKDTIVVADFSNTTGDPVFTDTLRQGLLVQLEQSPFLNILSDGRVQLTLRQTGRQPQGPLNDQLAREVCQRNQSKAFIAGSIARLGSNYVLGLRAVSCMTGDLLWQDQSQVPTKEGVLQSLDKQTSVLRQKLGESLANIEKSDVPLSQATTSSLEALQAYTFGVRKLSQVANRDALTYLNRAIQLDPDFAAAYARIGAAYANLEQSELADEYTTRAYLLRERGVTDLERIGIEAVYYGRVTGDLEKATRLTEVWKSTYPRDTNPYILLGNIYSNLGQYEKCVGEAREAFRRFQAQITYLNLADCLLFVGQFDEAKKLLAEAEARHLVGDTQFRISYQIAFLGSNQLEMERVVRAAAQDPDFERELLVEQSRSHAYCGRLNIAREFDHRAVAAARRSDLPETANTYLARAALREADFGQFMEARRTAAESLGVGKTRNVMFLASLAYARSGNLNKAQTLADELTRKYPSSTLLNLAGLPTIRAAIEIRRNNPARAIEILQQASSIELGDWAILQPAYTRGQAYLLLHRGAEAAAEFQKILDHPGVVRNDHIGALAHLWMARAHTVEKDIASARAEYEQFLTLWKNADSNILILKQAKAEYAKLQ